MRPLSVIVIAVMGVFLCASTSSIRNNDTQATYVFQDSVSPFATYNGIEDTQIAGGSQQPKRNFGGLGIFRIGFSSGLGGPHRALVRHNPYAQIDTNTVASLDSVIFTAYVDFIGTLNGRKDTVCVWAEADTRWVEGTGVGGATDTLGASGTCYNQRTAAAAESLWGAFRSGKGDSTYTAGIAGARVDSITRGYDPEWSRLWGRMTQGSVDRAPYPSAYAISDTSLHVGDAVNINITKIARYFWDQRLPLNLFISMKCDTVGRGAWGTADSCCASASHKLDFRSSENTTSKVTGPKLTYYVRLKRVPQMIGDRPGVR